MEQKLSAVLGGAGVLDVAGLAVTITPLSLREELLLEQLLYREAEKKYGDPYQRIRDMLASMPPEERAIAVQEAVRCAVRREPLSAHAIAEFRLTDPDWVAEEVYWRGKAATAGLTREGLKAIINSQNAPWIAHELQQIIRGGSDDPKATRSGASET